MKRVRVSVVILLFVLLFPSAVSYSSLDVLDSSCYADGSFTFTIENEKPMPVYTNEIQIGLRHAFLNFTPMASGIWTRTTIYDSINATNRSLRTASYLSAPGILTKGGDYFATLSYFGCRGSPNCRLSFLLNNCPDYNAQCEQTRLKALSCTLDDTSATVAYQGVQDEYETVLPEFDVFYYFEMADGSFIKFPRLTTVMSSEQIGLNKFSVVLPLENTYDVVGVSVVKKSCDAPRHQRKSIPCQQEVPAPEQPTLFDGYKQYMNIAPFYEEAVPGQMPDQELVIPDSAPVLEDIIPLVPQPPPSPPVPLPSSVPIQSDGADGQLPLVGAAVEVVPQAMPEPLVQDAQASAPGIEVKTRQLQDITESPDIPIHFYILLGIVAIGVLALVISNRRRPRQPVRPKRSWEAIWEDDKHG